MFKDGPCRIKICGIQTLDIAEQVGRLRPDLIGFVFAPGKRTVTPEQAGQMATVIRRSGSKAMLTGVFVNADIAFVEEAVNAAGLDVIQLHGDESSEVCAKLKRRFPGVKLIKVITPMETDDMLSIVGRLDPFRYQLDAIMLDTAGGGTGRTFDWRRIPDYQRWAQEAGLPLWVAGGLAPHNVTELVANYRPDGVDVSSGVETNGTKDIAKVTAFIERVRTVDQSST